MSRFKIYFLVFLLLATGSYLMWTRYFQEKPQPLYYTFPGDSGYENKPIPQDIINSKDCGKLREWMIKVTPEMLSMEMPDCPWEVKSQMGAFVINNVNLCLPRSYINVERDRVQGNLDELHVEFNFDNLEPVMLTDNQTYDASNYIDLIIKINPERALCATSEKCQSVYWKELVSLFEMYDSQPQGNVIQLRLNQKNYEGMNLDSYVIDNWKRCCIHDNNSQNGICKSHSPTLYIPSSEDPTNPTFWIQCVDGRDYMDFRTDKSICRMRNYYNDSKIAVDIYFDKAKYFSSYQDVQEKVTQLVNRFEMGYYNCDSDPTNNGPTKTIQIVGGDG